MTGENDVLFLTEGDAETWESLSGCSRSALLAMRRAGARVGTADVERSGPADWLAKALTFRMRRDHWVQHYHTSEVGFRQRSALARRLAATHPAGNPILQMGATFLTDTGEHPLYCLCDANAAFAVRGGEYSPLSALRDGEVRALLEREREVYSKCNAIFTFTEGLRQSFIDDFDVPSERVVTTFAGPNVDLFPTEEDLETPKEKDPTILFIGKQFERKGGPTLVEAFAKVRAVIPTARLRIVGCDPVLSNTDGIDLLGIVRRDDPGPRGLKSTYLTSDIFCMPSRYEPFGMVFSEAMVHGLPCIAPRRYMSEHVDEGETGWLVEADDGDGLADVLLEALEDRVRLRAMGRAGRDKAMRYFNWDRVAALMLESMNAGLPAS